MRIAYDIIYWIVDTEVNAMKFIHIADVHLGARPDRGRVWSDAREEEIEETFKDVLKVCEEQQVDLLLIAGDLFHEQPSLNRLKNIDYMFSKIPDTKIMIIAGNHDYVDEGQVWHDFKFSSNVVMFPKDKMASVYIKHLNVAVTGYSYGKQEYTERILEDITPRKEGAYNILLAHGGDSTHMPFSKDKLAKSDFDYIALGHIHKPVHILKNKMAFAGSLEPLDYTETGKHGYIMGEVDGEGKTHITFVHAAKRSYVNMAIEVAESYTNAEISDVIIEQIKKRGVDNIYRIMLKGIIDNDLQLNLSALTKQYNINEIIDNTEYGYDIDELVTNNESNLLGRYVKALRNSEDTTEDPEIRDKALRYGIEAMLGIL